MERSDLTWTPGGERSQARVEGRYNQCKGVITGEGSDRWWRGAITGGGNRSQEAGSNHWRRDRSLMERSDRRRWKGVILGERE